MNSDLSQNNSDDTEKHLTFYNLRFICLKKNQKFTLAFKHFLMISLCRPRLNGICFQFQTDYIFLSEKFSSGTKNNLHVHVLQWKMLQMRACTYCKGTCLQSLNYFYNGCFDIYILDIYIRYIFLCGWLLYTVFIIHI